jgi:two-component system sensor histidine kinase GlrK
LKLLQFYYPKSFLKLLLTGFVLVSLPLVIALVNAAISVQQLAGVSETAVDQAAQAARSSRLLMEQVLSMERLVRQFVILDDAALLDDYDKVRVSFKRTTSDLSLLPLDEEQLAELNRTIDKEQSLYELLSTPAARKDQRRTLVEGYVALSALARGVLNQSNQLIDREVERMRGIAERAQDQLALQLVAAFPLGVLIAALFAFVIARPIRTLERAIRRLGSAELGEPIRIEGPEDLRYIGDRLEWLRHRLAELEEQRVRFLRHVSHDLKTPLTALREGSELLAEGVAGPVNDKQREIIGILQSNSVHLQRLIEDLLNYQGAVASVSQLELVRVDIAEVVRTAAATHALAAAGRGIRIDVDASPAPLIGDGDKLRVVIDNLLSNAIKYSPERGVVSLGVRGSAEGVTVDVRDEGPGIAPEDRVRVFEWFYQAERAHGGRIKGSGLGLAIARELAASHGGSLEILDAERGAHFRLRLPVSPPRARTAR